MYMPTPISLHIFSIRVIGQDIACCSSYFCDIFTQPSVLRLIIRHDFAHLCSSKCRNSCNRLVCTVETIITIIVWFEGVPKYIVSRYITARNCTTIQLPCDIWIYWRHVRFGTWTTFLHKDFRIDRLVCSYSHLFYQIFISCFVDVKCVFTWF